MHEPASICVAWTVVERLRSGRCIPGVALMSDDDALRRTLELHQEQLVVGKVTHATLVKIATVTGTQDRTVDEMLTRDDVVIERIAIDQVVDAVPPVRVEDGVTIVPVVAEELVTLRRLVLKEEIHLRRVTTTERHTETVQLRQQTATVTRTPIEQSGSTEPASIQPIHSSQGNQAMSNELIVAVFDTAAHAEAAVRDLEQAGIPVDNVEMHRDTATTGLTTATTTASRPQGFWASLFGGEPDHDTGVYDRSIEGGSTVVSIRVPAEYVGKAADILELHHPIDIDERASGYGMTSTAPVTAPIAAPVAGTTATGTAYAGTDAVYGRTDESIQLSEENLAVGKRLVNRGGTRIRRYVVETPVEETVMLHEERVVLDRRPVTDDRVGIHADFSEKVIEMTETAEEAVVSKTAHVYEEVGLRKEVTDRAETIRDTLRREEVAVERVPGTETSNTTVTTPLPPKV